MVAPYGLKNSTTCPAFAGMTTKLFLTFYDAIKIVNYLKFRKSMVQLSCVFEFGL
jgi:hypothetical protein